MRKKKTLDDILYVILWIITIAAALAAAVISYKGISFPGENTPCMIRVLTGLYCPGCGGTRAFFLLFSGHMRQALLHHPAVVYVAAFCFLYLLLNTIKYVSRGKFNGLRYRNLYCYIGIAILIVNVVWKNYMLLAKGVALIP